MFRDFRGSEIIDDGWGLADGQAAVSDELLVETSPTGASRDTRSCKIPHSCSRTGTFAVDKASGVVI